MRRIAVTAPRRNRDEHALHKAGIEKDVIKSVAAMSPPGLKPANTKTPKALNPNCPKLP